MFSLSGGPRIVPQMSQDAEGLRTVSKMVTLHTSELSGNPGGARIAPTAMVSLAAVCNLCMPAPFF